MKSCAIFTAITSVVRALNERECGASWSASPFDRFWPFFLNEILNFSTSAPKAPYLRPISARNTGDMPTKFAQATYSNLNTPNMEWNFRWRAKNTDGWFFGGKVEHASFACPTRGWGEDTQPISVEPPVTRSEAANFLAIFSPSFHMLSEFSFT